MALIFRRKRTWVARASLPSLKRVESIPSSQLSAYLDTSTMALGCALDGWRYHGAPAEEVEKAIEAIAVLWSEVERRGLAKER